MTTIELLSTTEMATDLVAALSELDNAPRDGRAQYGKYATLPTILDMVRPVLAKHGFVMTQEDLTDGDFVGVRTRLHHRSGETLSFGPLFLLAGPNAQTAGSALTYARRYALTAALGIAADEDDDGAAASRKKSVPPTAQAGKESPPTLRAPGAEGVVPGTKVPASPAAAPISSTVADAGIESDGGPSPSEGAPASPGGDSSSAAPVGPGTEAEGARQDPVGNGEGPAGTEGSPQPPSTREALWNQLVQFAGTKRKALNAINTTMKASWTEGHIADIPEDDIEHTLKAFMQREGVA